MAEEQKQAEAKKEPAAAPAGKTEAGEKPARVKASNCVVCNKVLKRGNWYYRNGKFFCTKRCWKKSTEKVA
jgi:hypothetical protein